MNKKSLTGKTAVLGIVFLILGILTTGVLSMAAWKYLLLMVRKRKTSLFHDQMEQKTAESRLKRLKALLKVAGITFLVAIVGIISHNLLYGLSETEEPISFFIGAGALLAFIVATTGGLVISLQGRQEPIYGDTDTH